MTGEKTEMTERRESPEKPAEGHRYFPIFMDSQGQRVLVIGGGNVALRRVRTLVEFRFHISLVAEEIRDPIRALAEAGRIRLIRDRWRREDPEMLALLEGADMVLACTDDRDLNRQIGTLCRDRDIPVNLCDAREGSDFWFPAVAMNDELTMGLTGSGEDHATVRRAAAVLRRIIEEKSYRE